MPTLILGDPGEDSGGEGNSVRLDFPSPPLSAPGSPRMAYTVQRLDHVDAGFHAAEPPRKRKISAPQRPRAPRFKAQRLMGKLRRETRQTLKRPSYL